MMPLELRRCVVVEARDRVGLRVGDALDGLCRASAGERQSARGELVEDDTERKNVRASVDVAPESLFGAHVVDGPHHHPGRRPSFGGGVGIFQRLLRGRVFREAEVENFDLIPLGEHQVGRFDIPMNDALRMSRIQCVRGLEAYINNVGWVESVTFSSRRGDSLFVSPNRGQPVSEPQVRQRSSDRARCSARVRGGLRPTPS